MMRSATDPPGAIQATDDGPSIQNLPACLVDRWCRYCGSPVQGERCDDCDSEVLTRMAAMAAEKRRTV